MTRFAHVLTLIGVIAVPIFGWFVDDWSGATTLAVYWFETVAACLLIAGRILLHQRWSPRRGHFRYQAPSANRRSTQSSFLGGFLVVSLTFSAAHAVFLGVILFLLNHNDKGDLAVVDWPSVGFGCLGVLGFLAFDFLVDLLTLRQWSFRQLEQTTNQALSRVIVVHLTLILGFVGVALTGAPDAFFGTFVVLKSLSALSFALPQWQPSVAPKWLSRVMNRVPNVHPGETFEEFWAKDRAEEAERLTNNERPWKTPSVRSSQL
jgi:cytochrome b561